MSITLGLGASERAERDVSAADRLRNSRVVIGVDEAGYGPNIGPLVIAASAWRIPASMSEEELCKVLGSDFAPRPWTHACDHVPLGDSKKLYQPSSGLTSLETGLLVMLSQLKPLESCFANLLKQLNVRGIEAEAFVDELAVWHQPLEVPVPCSADIAELERLSQLARCRLQTLDIELLAVQSRVVPEASFNRAIAKLGSKGRLLSEVTLDLAVELMKTFGEVPLEIFCDRQGGRKKYVGVLLQAMPDEWFDILDEADQRSSYRRNRTPDCSFHFSVSGDSFPPTALASMTAKYLRERFMGIINTYWQSFLPELRPTAGYPGDAKRFRESIAQQATKLGHPEEEWWRVC